MTWSVIAWCRFGFGPRRSVCRLRGLTSAPTPCFSPPFLPVNRPQMLFTQLGHCNARLLAVGGTCPDNSDALYAKDFPKGYSRKMLISKGVWVTKKELAKEARQAQENVHHHFS